MAVVTLGIRWRASVSALRLLRDNPNSRRSSPLTSCAASFSSRSSKRCISVTPSALNIQRSDIPDIELPTGNLINTILKDVSRRGEMIATECSVTGRRYTYNQVMDRMARWGGVLHGLGVSKGDVVAVALWNCLEYPIVLFGAIAIGVVVSTVNPAYSPEEIALNLEERQPKVLVGDPDIEASLRAALQLYKRPIHLVMNGTSASPTALNLQRIIEDTTIPFADPITMTGQEDAVILSSSGTTGPPKGVRVTHNALSSNVTMIGHPHFNYVVPTTEESEQYCFMCLMPYFHIYGVTILMSSGFHQGVRLLSIPKFDPKTYVSTISKNKVQFLHLVPPLLNFLINSPEVTPESFSSVKSVCCGAAPVLPSAVEALREKTDSSHFYQEGWGMTEIQIATAVPFKVDKIGTTGKLLPNVTAKVVDLTTGETLSANQDGEICIKTPSVMAGYQNNPKATAETIDMDGWVHTGDVGHFDNDGFFKIVDRCKELIKVKGFQVSPSELEDLILQHPDVLDVGVVGVEDERLGEAPRAYVVPKKAIKEDDIYRFLEPKIAPYKRLVGGVRFVEELPKNATGKLLRIQLKKMAQRS